MNKANPRGGIEVPEGGSLSKKSRPADFYVLCGKGRNHLVRGNEFAQLHDSNYKTAHHMCVHHKSKDDPKLDLYSGICQLF